MQQRAHTVRGASLLRHGSRWPVLQGGGTPQQGEGARGSPHAPGTLGSHAHPAENVRPRYRRVRQPLQQPARLHRLGLPALLHLDHRWSISSPPHPSRRGAAVPRLRLPDRSDPLHGGGGHPCGGSFHLPDLHHVARPDHRAPRRPWSTSCGGASRAPRYPTRSAAVRSPDIASGSRRTDR